MKIHIISLFPESFESYFNSSMMSRARDKGYLKIYHYKLYDFSNKSGNQVDDKAYGMHGQVIMPEPLSDAIHHIYDKVGKKIKVIFLTPSGEMLTQVRIEKYSKILDEFIIICGHYEGIDQRIRDLYVDYEISIGKYVLTSGELRAMVFVDSIVRLIPGVLGNNESHIEDSFSKKLNRQKEYPVYTRPRIFEGLEVPEILVNGHHAKIEEWKKNNLS